ncbi:MAG: 4-hydroxy-3-methylbut-2-enyl diphosphate reductase [Chloroflexota bacterium]
MVESVVLVSPRGFCAGVVRAIATVERALAIFPPPVYVRRAIVHNSHVVARLAAAGATFVEELDDVPRGAVVVFSAHGVAAAVREQAKTRGLRVVDATCPMVAKVHQEVRRLRSLGFDVLLIGRAGHDEVVGTLGQVPGMQLVESVADAARLNVANPERVACVTQTTLSPQDVAPVVEQLRRRFPELVQPAPGDICFATRNRQAATTWLARNVDIVLVLGDRTSSNSRRLCEVASAAGTPAYLIGSLGDLHDPWLRDARVVGVSAGASTPEDLVAEVVDYLCHQGAVLRQEMFVDERVFFSLPRELAPIPAASAACCGATAPRYSSPVAS